MPHTAATHANPETHAPAAHGGGLSWMLRHPIFQVGVALSVLIFGVCYSFFKVTVPLLLGFSHWVIFAVLLSIVVCATLHLESGRDPATRR